MSEPKLCPLKRSTWDSAFSWGHCDQERCAWWVDEYRDTLPEYEAMTAVQPKITPGHCVMLDIGRTP
jgi:hypothetical protein